MNFLMMHVVFQKVQLQMEPVNQLDHLVHTNLHNIQICVVQMQWCRRFECIPQSSKSWKNASSHCRLQISYLCADRLSLHTQKKAHRSSWNTPFVHHNLSCFSPSFPSSSFLKRWQAIVNHEKWITTDKSQVAGRQHSVMTVRPEPRPIFTGATLHTICITEEGTPRT